MTYQEISLDQVVYREDLYPRIRPDSATIQRYAENLEVLPPIEINQHGILIDGYHRWTAHRKAEAPCIKAVITETDSEADTKYRSHYLHTFEQKNTVLFWQQCSDVGIEAQTDYARSLLMQQPLFVETILLRMVNAKPSPRNTKGIDGYFLSGASLEIKTSTIRRWDNLSTTPDYLLLLQVGHGAINRAYFGATEWLLNLFAVDSQYGAKTRIDARKELSPTYSQYNLHSHIVFATADLAQLGDN